MIPERGINANLKKIRAITEMLEPQKLKEVQRLTGCLVSLSHFVSKLRDKCNPFFLQISNKKTFQWTEGCKEAFQHIKSHLLELPTLKCPKPWDNLVPYLATTETTVSFILVNEEGDKQWSVYHTSNALRGAELNYLPLEKTIFALITSARKLWPFFQAHAITVRTNLPLCDILQCLNTRVIQSSASNWPLTTSNMRQDELSGSSPSLIL